jgi:hypothetical protein
MAIAIRPAKRRRGIARSTVKARFDYVTSARGKKLLDRQAKKYLNMSGAEFLAKYRAGEIPDPDRPEVIRVAMLIPFSDE